MEGTGLGSCPVANFRFSGNEPLDSASRFIYMKRRLVGDYYVYEFYMNHFRVLKVPTWLLRRDGNLTSVCRLAAKWPTV